MRIYKIVRAALAIAAASPAFAADLPVKVQSSTPAAINWAGFYVGPNAGYGWGTMGNSTATDRMNGILGGGQVGYNWQSGLFVFGLEGDWQFTNQRFSVTSGGVTGTEKFPWFATARGRLGYAQGPWLIYGTAGVAAVDYEVSFASATFTASGTATKFGYVGGAGVEWMFAPGWSGKFEYLYLDTGNTTWTLINSQVNARATNSIIRVGLNIHMH